MRLKSATLLVSAGVLGLLACGGSEGDGGASATGPATGTLEVVASTRGETLDEDGYTVTVDGTRSETLSPNGTVSFMELSEGSHDVELSDFQVNCTPRATSASVSIEAGETKTLRLDVRCAAAIFDKIIFSSSEDAVTADQVYRMNPDGTSQTPITTGEPPFMRCPSFSPDGTKIVFEYTGSAWTLNADGTNLVELYDSAECPTWSPDGSKIAFQDDVEDEIFTINPDGTGLEQITGEGHAESPTWSPDGSRIAYLSNRGGVDWHIYTANKDGSGAVQVADLGPDQSFDHLDWSPAGSRFLFLVERNEIWTMNTDGGDVRKIFDTSQEGGLVSEPRWSPDGSVIAFDWRYNIYTIRADGTNPVNLTGNRPETSSSPGWSPTRKD